MLKFIPWWACILQSKKSGHETRENYECLRQTKCSIGMNVGKHTQRQPTWNTPIKKLPKKKVTCSFAWQHHSSNSANPDFTYSPLLNVQHSRRRRRLEHHKKNSNITKHFSICRWRNKITNYLLKSCTLIYEKVWVKIFWTRIGGTWNPTTIIVSLHLKDEKNPTTKFGITQILWI